MTVSANTASKTTATRKAAAIKDTAVEAPKSRKDVEALEDAAAEQATTELREAIQADEVKKVTLTKRDRVRALATEKGFTLVNHYKGNDWTVAQADGTELLMDSTNGTTQPKITAAMRNKARKEAAAAAKAKAAADKLSAASAPVQSDDAQPNTVAH